MCAAFIFYKKMRKGIWIELLIQQASVTYLTMPTKAARTCCNQLQILISLSSPATGVPRDSFYKVHMEKIPLLKHSFKSCNVKTFAKIKTELSGFQKDSKVDNNAKNLLLTEC